MVSWWIELNQTAKKGTVELQKDKRLVGYPCADVFCEVYGPNKFFYEFLKQDAFECRTHEVCRLRPVDNTCITFLQKNMFLEKDVAGIVLVFSYLFVVL